MCDCIKQLNELLHEIGETISLVTSYHLKTNTMGTAIQIKTERCDDKKKRIRSNLIADYCPFCGKKFARVKRDGADGAIDVFIDTVDNSKTLEVSDNARS